MTPIHVIVPAFNCPKWIDRCLASLAEQDYPFDAIVIDDASPDPFMAEQISTWCTDMGWTAILNDENRRAGYNIYTAGHAFNASFDDVIFLLDGDDFLPHRGVLERVAEIYEDPEAWFAYGQYEPKPHNTGQVLARPIPPDLLRESYNGSYRHAESYFNHPISYRFFLFNQLTERDMQDDKGQWLRAGYDRVMFTPMLELAGEHYRFCEDVLYCYNAINPISDTFANLGDAQYAHGVVVNRPPRPRLNEKWVQDQREFHRVHSA